MKALRQAGTKMSLLAAVQLQVEAVASPEGQSGVIRQPPNTRGLPQVSRCS